ncbi:MAG TPA: molybdenum cofactor guanylyltransferase [Gemmatimonadaceae bacterium]|nr:molybdenum cofactor guanylyltransferase [Gemmatimonadaceae bacterium]
MPSRSCTGAILAGGRSARFGGSPKGLSKIGGVRLLDRVATALAEACDELVLVANDGAARTWLAGVTAVPDARAGVGALGGLHAALAHARGDVMTLPWDAPFVPGALLRALREAGEFTGADAAVPASSVSPWGFEPLCAWYAPSCLPAIERHLDSEDYRAGGWQPSVRMVSVDVSAWGDPAVVFYNINTPEDLVRAEQLFRTLNSP